MGISIAFMIVALVVGVFRLMAQNGVGPVELSQLYALHPLFMVFGFLAGIIMTERIAGVELLPSSSKTWLVSVMPPLIFAGILTETAGYLYDSALARYDGASLLVIASLLFMVLLSSFYKKGRGNTPVIFMLISAFALLASSVLSASSLPAGNVGFVMLLLSFPVVFVLGERADLTSVATRTTSDRFLPALFFSGASVFLFSVGAFVPSSASDPAWLVAFALLGAAFAVIMVAERRAVSRQTTSPFQQYVSRHVGLAYAWGLEGAAFGIAYLLSPLFAFYDAFIHSLALGFIGLMLLAHGPIVLPTVLRKEFDNARLSYAPLSLLSLAIALRIGAELVLLQAFSSAVEFLVAASGWLVLAAVLAFFVEIIRGVGFHERANLEPA
jgi:nitrite reductase (NO-forming)